MTVNLEIFVGRFSNQNGLIQEANIEVIFGRIILHLVIFCLQKSENEYEKQNNMIHHHTIPTVLD